MIVKKAGLNWSTHPFSNINTLLNKNKDIEYLNYRVMAKQNYCPNCNLLSLTYPAVFS
jgi:hypothetical protein